MPAPNEHKWQNWEASTLELNGVLLGTLTHFSEEEIHKICSTFPEFGPKTVVGQTAEVFFLYGSSICARNPTDPEGVPV